jgi:hypothetical protein
MDSAFAVGDELSYLRNRRVDIEIGSARQGEIPRCAGEPRAGRMGMGPSLLFGRKSRKS